MAEPAISELQRLAPDLTVVWRAFELRPDPVPTLDPNGDYLRRVWSASVYPLARRLGMRMQLPPVQPRSRRAHEAALWARRHRRFDEYHAGLFRAFFERGEDIGRMDVLTRLASDIGLPADELHGVLETRELEASVLADEAEAERLGISAVPAFVADRRAAITGVQPVEGLISLVDHVRRQTPRSAADP